MTDQPNSAPDNQDKSQIEAPAAPEAGKAIPQGASQDDLPEKFKGKSASEIAKSYLELEKQFGEHSQEVKQTRDEIAQWQALGNVIKGNPKLREEIQVEIDRISGKKPDNADKSKPTEPTRDDTRIALENEIINNFEEKFGLHRLDNEKKKVIDKAIGTELAEMFDPGGTKPPSEVLRVIPLDKLSRVLEKAYRLATLDDEKEQVRSQAYLDAKLNNEAKIGSMPSSGAQSETIILTPEQREAAKRMNVSEENYKKQLIAIQKGE